jgi:hypothetical protein
MRFRDFAASCIITGGLMLAPAVCAANPGDPLTPAITVESGSPYAALASNPAGEFVLAWSSGTYTSAQAFDSAGHTLSAPFPIEAPGSVPAVAVDSVGGFTAAWDTSNSAGQIVAQRFTLTGAALTSKTVVSNLDSVLSEIDHQSCYLNAVGTSTLGQFVVAWNCYAIGSFVTEYPAPVYADIALHRSFSRNGLAVLPETAPSSDFLAALKPLLLQEDGPMQPIAPVAVAPNGSFAMVWDDTNGIYGRRFDLLGLPLGPEALLVPGGASAEIGVAGIALGQPDGSGQIGNYVLAWFNVRDFTLNVQSFGSNNQPVGQPVSVPSSYQYENGQIATDAAGNFVLVGSNAQNLTAQFFLANGTARTGVISLPISVAADPDGHGGFNEFQLASDAAGNITIAWARYRDTNPDIYTGTVYVQRFAGAQ